MDFKKIFLIISVLLTFPLISASYFNRYYGYLSPSDLLENEWIVFSALFLLFFAVIFFSLLNFFSKSEKKAKDIRDILMPSTSKNINKAPLVVISMIVSFFISAAMVREDIFSSYFGYRIIPIVNFILFIIFIILGFFIFNAFKKKFGTPLSLGITSLIVWTLIKITDLTQAIDLLRLYEFYPIYDFLQSYWSLAIIIFISIVLYLNSTPTK